MVNVSRVAVMSCFHDQLEQLRPMSILAHMFVQELAHQTGDLVAISFQSEMASVEQMEIEGFQIALVRLGTSGRENLVVLPPRDQHWRLVLAEVFLPAWIQRRVATVAEK